MVQMTSRLSLIIVAIVVAACKRDNSAKEIVVLGEDSGNLAAISNSGLLLDFEKQSGVKVRIVAQTFEKLQENASLDLAGKGTPQFDVVLNYNFALSLYSKNKWILPYAELTAAGGKKEDWKNLESSFFEKHWREVGWLPRDNEPADSIAPIALPFAANTIVLAVNRRLVPNRDSATTSQWSRLKAELVRLQESGVRAPLVMTGATGGWLYYEWAAIVGSTAGGAFDKQYGWQEGATHRSRLLDSAIVSATESYLALKPFSRGDFFSVGAVEQKDIILSDSVAFAFVWSDYARELKKVADERNVRIEFVPMPGSASMIAGGAAFVNRRTTHRKEVAEFLQFLLSRPVQDSLAKLGYQSPVSDVLAGSSSSSDGGLRSAVHQSLLHGAYMNDASSDATVIAESLTQALQEAWRGKRDARSALRFADSLIAVAQRQAKK